MLGNWMRGAAWVPDRVNVKIRGWITAVVEGQRNKVGQGVDAEAAANDRFGVVKRAIGKS